VTPREQALVEAAREMLTSIERRWGNESAKKRENAISPRMEDAIEALSAALSQYKDKETDNGA